MKTKRVCSLFLCLLLLFSLYPQNVLATIMDTITITVPANLSTISSTIPVYMGTADPETKISIKVDNKLMATLPSDVSGYWDVNQTTALAEGSHTLRAAVLDSSYNETGPAATISFTVDSTPPPAPVVITPGYGSGIIDNMPTITGTAEPQSTVTVYIDGIDQSTMTADGSGSWSFSLPTPLADGSHTVKAKAKDSAGNTSTYSNTITFTVDTTPPSSPTVVTPPNGSMTSNDTPSISGMGEAVRLPSWWMEPLSVPQQ